MIRYLRTTASAVYTGAYLLKVKGNDNDSTTRITGTTPSAAQADRWYPVIPLATSNTQQAVFTPKSGNTLYGWVFADANDGETADTRGPLAVALGRVGRIWVESTVWPTTDAIHLELQLYKVVMSGGTLTVTQVAGAKSTAKILSPSAIYCPSALGTLWSVGPGEGVAACLNVYCPTTLSNVGEAFDVKIHVGRTSDAEKSYIDFDAFGFEATGSVTLGLGGGGTPVDDATATGSTTLILTPGATAAPGTIATGSATLTLSPSIVDPEPSDTGTVTLTLTPTGAGEGPSGTGTTALLLTPSATAAPGQTATGSAGLTLTPDASYTIALGATWYDDRAPVGSASDWVDDRSAV